MFLLHTNLSGSERVNLNASSARSLLSSYPGGVWLGYAVAHTLQEGGPLPAQWPPSLATTTSSSLQLSSRTRIWTQVLLSQWLQKANSYNHQATGNSNIYTDMWKLYLNVYIYIQYRGIRGINMICHQERPFWLFTEPDIFFLLNYDSFVDWKT